MVYLEVPNEEEGTYTIVEITLLNEEEFDDDEFVIDECEEDDDDEDDEDEDFAVLGKVMSCIGIIGLIY